MNLLRHSWGEYHEEIARRAKEAGWKKAAAALSARGLRPLDITSQCNHNAFASFQPDGTNEGFYAAAVSSVDFTWQIWGVTNGKLWEEDGKIDKSGITRTLKRQIDAERLRYAMSDEGRKRAAEADARRKAENRLYEATQGASTEELDRIAAYAQKVRKATKAEAAQ